jgi:HD-GYP domain-containing protein (c-di-GMP phosphodiesterase class II)
MHVLQEVNSMSLVPGIEHLTAALREKHFYLFRHSQRTAHYAYLIGQAVGLRSGQLVALQRGGMLHDLGKLFVPQSILEKPAALTPDEWEIIKRHPSEGHNRLLGKVDPAALEIVRCHHEHYDGSGYPDHIKGDAIPVLARVVAIADAFDVMTSDRMPWRVPVLPMMALDELRLCSGTQFDPILVDMVDGVFPEIMGAYEEMSVLESEPVAIAA